MSKEYLRVREFNDFTTDTEEAVNVFLVELGTRVVSVTPMYNTIAGGIMYVVVYWC